MATWRNMVLCSINRTERHYIPTANILFLRENNLNTDCYSLLFVMPLDIPYLCTEKKCYIMQKFEF